MVMAALEDKTYRGGGHRVAVDGVGLGHDRRLLRARTTSSGRATSTRSPPRRSRPATAAAAERALDYLWERQQQPDGCFPQNSNLDGSPHWPNLQLDEVADPILLAWQLGRFDAAHVGPRPARRGLHPRARPGLAGALGERRRATRRRRSRAEIAGARVRGRDRRAQRRGRRGGALPRGGRRLAGERRRAGRARRNGPLADAPVLPAAHRSTATPNAGTTYTIGDGGPTIDQRARRRHRASSSSCGSASSPPTTPTSLRRCRSSTASSASTTPNGQFWHRYNHDGYGETPDGGPFPGPRQHAAGCGRSSPASAASTSCAAGDAPAPRAARAAATRSPRPRTTACMLPEQVWDENPPSGRPASRPATGTLSATPLGWTHAQFVRLAWSIDAGRPVERPRVVACRYAGTCR